MSRATDKQAAGFTRRVAKLWSVFNNGAQDRQVILDGLQRLAEGKMVTDVEPESYAVSLFDADQSFDERKEAAGPWSYWNPNITEANFPTLAELPEMVELRLHHFNRGISDADVTRELDALGFVREDRLPVILAFLEANPDIQREFPIITGATWVNSDGDSGVVYARGDAQNRNLDLGWADNGWRAGCRFLVRRK